MKSGAPKMPKQAKESQKGLCNKPTKLQFHSILTRKIFMLSKRYEYSSGGTDVKSKLIQWTEVFDKTVYIVKIIPLIVTVQYIGIDTMETFWHISMILTRCMWKSKTIGRHINSC